MVGRVTWVLLVLAVVAMATACGTGGNAVPGADVPAETSVSAGGTAFDSGLLTPADVERVSGLTGLTVASPDPQAGIDGDINIVDGDGRMVVLLITGSPELWDAWMTDGFTVGEDFSPPVGDKSFIGPNPDESPNPYIFGFRKRDVVVVLEAGSTPDGAPPALTIDQLRALAEIVVARL